MPVRSIYKYNGIKFGLLAAILVIVLTYLGLFANLLQRLEYWALDYRFRLASKNIDASEIVIIAINDKSIQELGTWPWPRSYHARLIDFLNRAEARVIGLDMIFSTSTVEQDHQLAEAIKNAQNVITVAHPMIPAQISFPRNIMTVGHIQSPIAKVAEVARGIGHIAVVYDDDGIVRRAPALLRTKDKTLLAFGIEVALAYRDEEYGSIGIDKDSLRVNSIKIPLDSKGNMLINYIGGPYSFPEIPYHSVIQGEVPSDFFKDKIVLVGVTASGLSDFWATPFMHQGRMSGAELHANVVHTIINKGFFMHLGNRQGAFLLLFLGVVSGFIFYRFPCHGRLIFIFMILFTTSASIYLFLNRRILLDTIPLLSVLLATYIPIAQIKSKENKMGILKRDLEMSAVFKMSEVFERSKGNLEDFLKSVCDLTAKIAGADVCYAIVNRGDKEVIVDGTNQKISGDLANHETVQKVLRTAKPILTDKDQRTSRIRGAMYVPIKSINHVYGVLFLERDKPFDTRDRDLASVFTDYVAFTLERDSVLHQMQEAYVQTIHAFAKVMDVKYPHIHRHSSQVSELAVKMAATLSVPKDEIEVVRYAALLHDLGMIGIPEDILYKSDPLTTEEKFHIESHPETGVEVIRPITFLKRATHIIRHHHERYDGKGYPDGLAGDEIPLVSQILAVADSLVAMLSDRPYRKARKQEDAVSEIKRQSGSQFNPKVVSALLQSLHEVDPHEKKNNS